MIAGFEVFGEVKRYEDNFSKIKSDSNTLNIKARSIFSTNDEKAKDNTRIPRYLELKSKLKDVHKQLSANAINLIFLYHSSIGETEGYIKQVLFGENNFFLKSNKLILEENSLYSKKEWNNISALFLCKRSNARLVDFYEVFINPNTTNILSGDVINKIKSAL